MSRTLKWILGILAVLVIVGVVAAAVFVWWNHAPLGISRRLAQAQPNAPALSNPPAVPGTPGAPGAPALPGNPALPNNPPPSDDQNGPVMPFGFRGEPRPYLEGRGWNPPMMRERGFGPRGFFNPFGFGLFFVGGFLRCIVPLGVLAVVAVLFYLLGRRAGASARNNPPPSNPPAAQPGRKVANS